MGWANKTVSAALALGILYSGYVGVQTANTMHRSRQITMDYVDANLDNLMRKSEQKFSITYCKKPTMEYASALANQYTGQPAFSQFDGETDTITIAVSGHVALMDSSVQEVDKNSKVTKLILDNGSDNLISRLLSGAQVVALNADSLEKSINHELGHLFVDCVEEGLGIPPTSHDKIGNSSRTLVSEGIAYYFQSNLLQDPSTSDYIQSRSHSSPGIEKFFLRLPREHGPHVFEYRKMPSDFIAYYLVEPIIKLYTKDGIVMLIANPPNFQDIM